MPNNIQIKISQIQNEITCQWTPLSLKFEILILELNWNLAILVFGIYYFYQLF